jgi:xylulokinase
MTTSHILSHPTDPGGKIAMLCYKNGGLAREHVRDRFANGDWDVFSNLVEQCPPGCNGYMGFYFPLPEIIPPGVVGEYFFATQLTDQSSKTLLTVKDIPESVHPRAIIESQLLSIRSRVAAILPQSSPLKRLIVTGGSSANETIRQMIGVRSMITPD